MYPQSFILIYGFLPELWMSNLNEKEKEKKMKNSAAGATFGGQSGMEGLVVGASCEWTPSNQRGGMEALRTKCDSLEWEVHRLRAENRKLREENPEASERVDCAAELERTKETVVELTDCLDEKTREKDNEETRAEEAEQRAIELEQLAERKEDVEEVARLCATLRTKEEDLAKAERALSEWESRWCERDVQQRATEEAMLQRAKLERYQVLERERQRWQERENRLLAQLAEIKQELRETRTVDYKQLNNQLQSMGKGWQAVESVVHSLAQENQQFATVNRRLCGQDSRCWVVQRAGASETSRPPDGNEGCGSGTLQSTAVRGGHGALESRRNGDHLSQTRGQPEISSMDWGQSKDLTYSVMGREVESGLVGAGGCETRISQHTGRHQDPGWGESAMFAKLLVEEVVSCHGVPSGVLSDRQD